MHLNDRFAPTAVIPLPPIPRIEPSQSSASAIRGLPNEITPSRNIGPPLTPEVLQLGAHVGCL
jgi:hypothetical protein